MGQMLIIRIHFLAIIIMAFCNCHFDRAVSINWDTKSIETINLAMKIGVINHYGTVFIQL